jgi:hypothetical protein
MCGASHFKAVRIEKAHKKMKIRFLAVVRVADIKDAPDRCRFLSRRWYEDEAFKQQVLNVATRHTFTRRQIA